MTIPETLRRVSFTVAGMPVTQGSKVAFNHRYTGQAMMKEQLQESLDEWRGKVTAEAYRVMLANPPGEARMALNGPLGVSLAFTLREPASAPKRRRTWPIGKKNDIDKLVRAVFDALTGPVFVDDGQVVVLNAWKLYPGEGGFALDSPGVLVDVWQIGEDS